MRWVVGDIHGMRIPLAALLDAVRRLDGDARFYFVGDYVNRGSESRQVVDLLMSMTDARFIRGNHDDVFDQVLHGQAYTGETGESQRLAAFRAFCTALPDVTEEVHRTELRYRVARTFAVGFLVRPVGGFVFGHVGDRIGRKKTLALTMFLPSPTATRELTQLINSPDVPNQIRQVAADSLNRRL